MPDEAVAVALIANGIDWFGGIGFAVGAGGFMVMPAGRRIHVRRGVPLYPVSGLRRIVSLTGAPPAQTFTTGVRKLAPMSGCCTMTANGNVFVCFAPKASLYVPVSVPG